MSTNNGTESGASFQDMQPSEHRNPALAEVVRSAMRNLRHVEEELARDRRSMWAEDSEVVELRARVAELQAERDELRALVGTSPTQMPHGHATAIARWLIAWFKASGAEHFVSVDFRDDETDEWYVVAAHKRDGMSPAKMLEQAERKRDEARATANALRDAMEKADAAFNAWARDEDGIHPDAWPAVEHLRATLKAHPAASLAALKAEVLERAAKAMCRDCECNNPAREVESHWFHDMTIPGEDAPSYTRRCRAEAIRVLLAQEVTP